MQPRGPHPWRALAVVTLTTWRGAPDWRRQTNRRYPVPAQMMRCVHTLIGFCTRSRNLP